MGRKSREHAEQVAAQASEAARLLQQRGQEVRQGREQETPVGPKPEPRNERRDALEGEIEQREAQQREAETQEQPEIKEEPKAETAAPVAQEAPEPVPTVAAEVPEKPAVETVRVKVDGEEFDVPKADVEEAGGIRAYQTARAAENRLTKVNQELAETRKVQAALAQWAASQQQAQQPPQVTDGQFIAQKLDAIRYGTPEEGASALSEILQRTQQKAPDAQVITAQAVAQMSRKLAVDRFKEEFSDIVTNPDLLQFAAVIEQQELSKVQPMAQLNIDWNDHYRRIGNKIRSVVGRQHQPTLTTTTTGNTSQPSEKEARKASIVTLPTAAARAEAPQEEKPETREDMIRDLKKSRGLPIG